MSTFDSFFVSEYPRLVATLTAWCGSRATAEDIAQDALTQAHRNWGRVAPLDNPGTWVRRVALNRSHNESRRRSRERRALRIVENGTAPAATSALLDEDLWRAVRRLPTNQRDAVVLRYVDDLSVADIAGVLGCSEGSVKAHLSRARKKLAERLGAHSPEHHEDDGLSPDRSEG